MGLDFHQFDDAREKTLRPLQVPFVTQRSFFAVSCEIIHSDCKLVHSDCELVHSNCELVHSNCKLVHTDCESVHMVSELVHAYEKLCLMLDEKFNGSVQFFGCHVALE